MNNTIYLTREDFLTSFTDDCTRYADSQESKIPPSPDIRGPGVVQLLWKQSITTSLENCRLFPAAAHWAPLDELEVHQMLDLVDIHQDRDTVRPDAFVPALSQRGSSSATPASASSSSGLSVLVMVHLGNACGSATLNLGAEPANEARDRLVGELSGWTGPLVVFDDALSDELFDHPVLNKALSQAIERAEKAGHLVYRSRALFTKLPMRVREFMEKAGPAVANAQFKVSGAWYEPAEGGASVGRVIAELQRLGYQAEPLDSAMRIHGPLAGAKVTKIQTRVVRHKRRAVQLICDDTASSSRHAPFMKPLALNTSSLLLIDIQAALSELAKAGPEGTPPAERLRGQYRVLMGLLPIALFMERFGTTPTESELVDLNALEALMESICNKHGYGAAVACAEMRSVLLEVPHYAKLIRGAAFLWESAEAETALRQPAQTEFQALAA